MNDQGYHLNKFSKVQAKKGRIGVAVFGLVGVFVGRLKKNVKRSKLRKKILREWYETEKNYQSILDVSINCVKRKMLHSSYQQFVTAEQAQTIFTNFQKILGASHKMNQIIAKSLKTVNPNRVTVGADLLKIIDLYSAYTAYVQNRKLSQSLLQKIRQINPQKYSQLQESAQSQMKKIDESKKCLTLKDYAETPFYRIFKYILLLKQYIRHMPENHPDFIQTNQLLTRFHNQNVKNNTLLQKLEQKRFKDKIKDLVQKKFPQKQNLASMILVDFQKSELITDLQIETIHFKGKVYVYTDIVFITKFQEKQCNSEELYQIIHFDQFAYVSLQRNLKYFKNMVIFIGKQGCMHFLMPDPVHSYELFKCFNQMLRKQRINSEKNEKCTKRHQQSYFRSEFRFEVLGLQTREITSIQQDIVYIIRLMTPYYHQKQIKPGLSQKQIKRIMSQRLQETARISLMQQKNEQYNQAKEIDEIGTKRSTFLSINQVIQLRISDIQTIFKKITKQYLRVLNDNFKQQQQILNCKNVLKKTKMYELQKFHIEEFFNFIFRDKRIMKNPIWLLKELKIYEPLWDYIISKNHLLIDQPEKCDQFGFDHCSMCFSLLLVNKIEVLQNFRKEFLMKSLGLSSKSISSSSVSLGLKCKDKKSTTFCFNFFNCLRLRILALNPLEFKFLEQILFYDFLVNGRIDYCFIEKNKKQCLQKGKDKVMILKVYLADVQKKFINVEVYPTTKVGQIIDQVGEIFGMTMPFDYQLMVTINGRNKILDRDGDIHKLALKMNLEYYQVSSKDLTAAKERGEKLPKANLIDRIKIIGSDYFSTAKSQNKVIFFKTIYLHKTLQTKSFHSYPKKKKLYVNQIFYMIKNDFVKLDQQVLIEFAALFYCFKSMAHKSMQGEDSINLKVLQKIVSESQSHSFEFFQQMSEEFIKQVKTERKKMEKMMSRSSTEKISSYIFDKIITKAINIKDFFTYYIEVQCVDCPEKYLQKIKIKKCLLGVNFKEIVVTKSVVQTEVVVVISLKNCQFFTSMFSLFLQDEEGEELRFDGKMVFHFGEIMNKYINISHRFPQHFAG